MTAQGDFHNPCFLLPWEFFARLLMVGAACWGGHRADCWVGDGSW